MVIASGRSDRHVGAIADQIATKLKAAGWRGVRVEGLETCDWVLVDAGDIIVHVFRPEVREFYNLEKMWQADFRRTSRSTERAGVASRPVNAPATEAHEELIMRLMIAAVGKLKDDAERDICERYPKRFNASGRPLGLGPLVITELSEARGDDGRAQERRSRAAAEDGGAMRLADCARCRGPRI